MAADDALEDILRDLGRATITTPSIDLARHAAVLRAAANVVQAARAAVAADGFPGGAGPEVMGHLADVLEAFDGATC